MKSSTDFLKPFLKLLLIILCGNFYKGSCLETDYLNTNVVLKDSDTINSSGRQFTLGFFSPNGTNRRYLGIWYFFSPSSVVWVANKDQPLNDTSGTATISSDGNIVVMNGNREILWSSDAVSSPTNATARLLDSGNLVLIDSFTGITIWESHRHPGNSFLPMMRLTYDTRTHESIVLNSWRSPHDPRNGNFSFGLIEAGVSQVYSWDKGLPYWRSGPWNGRLFTGVAAVDVHIVYAESYTIANDGNGTYYELRALRQDLLLKTFLDTDGTIVEETWDNKTKQWNVRWRAPIKEYELYNKCGPFGLCYEKNTPICSCLIGYEPKNKEEWRRGNWSEGCVRKTLLQCERENNASDKSREDAFSRLAFIKVPDFTIRLAIFVENECRSRCLRNCSCLAYAFDLGIGCMHWSETLIDAQRLVNNVAGLDLYVRIAYSELGKSKDNKVVITASVMIASLVAASTCLFLSWRICKDRKGNFRTLVHGRAEEGLLLDLRETFTDGVDIKELPLYSYDMVTSLTNDFNVRNKLGMGGYGPVYRAKLENGQEIAVKRLATASGQGLEEFMNEVLVISKLQHRNLVRLLGCCVEKEEKMLIYEYLRNGSLDLFLFDKPQDVLDWRKRFNIIEGIGRGLLYLHRDSRLKIIHRDLKPSNILLDEHWNPKISDFGTAKIFGCNQAQANTGRVMGTYGYMAPEYAMRGIFSEKSDVFSFGVLMLEIISGRRNTSFYNNELSLGLLGYAWKLWNEDNLVKLIDERISSPKVLEEIMRCLWIGLLCVQESPQSRPIISTVLAMISSEIIDLPVPEHPGFTDKWSYIEPSVIAHNDAANSITITVMEGR